ncbi:substrate-binding domain-containing protein [candidate division KSB1 bacterium]
MVTIKNIAEKAGVSIGTVDRVLHNRGNVSKRNAKKIQDAIEELKYRPNIFARNLKLSRDFSFGVLMPEVSQDSSYWQFPENGIKRAANELSKQRINVSFFHYDRYSQLSFSQACHKILESNLDGLLIAPVLSHIAKEFLENIPENLPYVFFDSVIPKTPCLSYIIQDSYLSGRLSAKLIKMIIKEPGTIAAIRVLPEDFHINERINGFQSFISENNSLNLVIYDAFREDDVSVFHELTEKIISETKDLKGIFVSNALTWCVARYFESVKMKNRIRIIGYDLIEENRNYLKNGYIDFLISQQPEMQGYQGIYALYRHVVLSEKISEKIMMPLDIITEENIDYYAH